MSGRRRPPWKRAVLGLFPFWAFEWSDPQAARARELVESEAMALAPGARVLDAGAGDAPYRSLFAGHQYVACDLRLSGPEAGYEWSRLDVVCRLEELPFADGSFDLVLATEVLEHMPDPDAVLAQVRRVLRPGGRLVGTVPFMVPEHHVPHDYHRYTRYGLEVHLRRGGLVLEDLVSIEGFLTTLCILVRSYLGQLPRHVTWLSPAGPLGRVFGWALRLVIGPLLWVAHHADRLHLVMPAGWSERWVVSHHFRARVDRGAPP